MLAEGLSNKLIAHGLAISEHAVKYHVSSTMAKLHVGNRTVAGDADFDLLTLGLPERLAGRRNL